MESELPSSGNTDLRVVIDTNIIVSAYIFGGQPQLILQSVITEQIEALHQKC